MAIGENMTILKPRHVAKILNVTVTTLQIWDRLGKLDESL
jgi:DNA-binding transcriptional MerR regulator